MVNESTPEVRHTRGSCLCGKITYEITGEPFASGICHCGNCKKSSGAAFVWNVSLWQEQVHVTSGDDILKTFEDTGVESGNTLYRKFCSNCGSSLFVTGSSGPNMIVVATGGIIDIPEEWKPMREVYCQDRAKWLPDIDGQFRLTSGEDIVKKYDDSDTDSGNTFVRSFCSNCGSSLFGVRRDKPEVIILMTGCIKDTPAEWSPGMAIYCKYRAKWLPDVEGVEYFEV
ncbi:hypothetical protein PHLCEN_2v2244 [Hermanssonia centrifuga]|uniref:CENP-V/GFA domain-containing protein n=1 Tax=Hermanssonia centrifuga TaxID=98765 RepID=A0A2R6RPP6_9APHY|nr:hypothetical protein PHLCEN_2v2244 [Hermanssonia centrifuga]